jgi:hypothetical protein
VKRGAATMAYTLALGRADLYPEPRITLRGFKPEIDAITWLIHHHRQRRTHHAAGTRNRCLRRILIRCWFHGTNCIRQPVIRSVKPRDLIFWRTGG